MLRNNEELSRILKLCEGDEISRFGKLFKTTNSCYFYDTGTSKVILLDEDTYKLLLELMNSDSINQEKYVNSKTQGELELLDEFLYCSKTENLFRAFKPDRLCGRLHNEDLENQIGSNIKQLILEVTGICNLRCGYCIYNESYEGNREFNSKIMSRKIAFKGIDYLEKHGGEEVAVTFYGGEPLLQYDLVKACIEYAKEKLSGRKLSYSLTSNLTLMTEERATYFASVDNMSIVCSIDGPKRIHDSYRKYPNGEGSFEAALVGLKNLIMAYGEKASKNISINIVYAPPYTYEKLEEINAFFEQLEWLPEDVRIDITYAADGSVDDKESVEELMSDESYLTEQGTFNPLYLWGKDKFLKKGKGLISKSGIEGMLLKIHKRDIYKMPIPAYPFNACCVPGARRLYITTDGEMLVCERVGNSPSIGNVFDGINLEKIKKHYIEDYSKYSSEECKKCWAIRLCERCYVGNYNKDGFYNKRLHEQCEEMRMYVERELSYYHEINETTPEDLDYLNRIEIS